MDITVPFYSSSPVLWSSSVSSGQRNPMKPSHLLQVSVIQRLGAHHAAIQLLWVGMCPHPLLCLAVRAALAVEAAGWVTWAGQGGVKSVGRQRAGEEVLV